MDPFSVDLSSLNVPDPFASSGSGTPLPLDLGSYLGGTPNFNEMGSSPSWTGDLANTLPTVPDPASSSPDFFSSVGDALGNAFGTLAGQGLGIATELGSYGLTSLGNRAAQGIGQSTGQLPQYLPVATGAPAMSSTTLLILLAVAGVGMFLVMKGK